jgi:threonine/homoserine/homoserine lactone efflux protein
MGIVYALFASLLLAWPSERARRLTDFGQGGLSAAAAALAGWILSGMAVLLPPLAAAYLALHLAPDFVEVWSWIGIAALFWLASTGKLAPSLAFRPFAANDNAPVRGNLRILSNLAARGYSWRIALVMASLMPQFLDTERPAEPQILFALLIYMAVMLLSAAFYGLFPQRAHLLLNLIPERRKALKSGLNGYRQHGQTRISYRRIAA